MCAGLAGFGFWGIMIPGLKAWAIFGSPFGTFQKLRCSLAAGVAVLASLHLLLNLDNLDCIQGDRSGFKICGPSGTWPSLRDASEREAVWEKLQALKAPVGE